LDFQRQRKTKDNHLCIFSTFTDGSDSGNRNHWRDRCAGGQLGPIYPGAKISTTAVSVQPDAKVYETADALPKVAAWYAKHTPAGSELVNTKTFALFQVGKTQISLHILPGRTTIGLTGS
jgi:hypothetical protein